MSGAKTSALWQYAGIFRELVGQHELVEDAGGHEDGFARPHRQGEDVVRVDAGIGLHLTIDQLKQFLCWFLEHAELSNLAKAVS